MQTSFSLISFCFFVVLVSYAIVQLAYGNAYNSDILCDAAKPVITARTWLLVAGTIELFFAFLTCVITIATIYGLKNIWSIALSGICIQIEQIFSYTWTIIGSFIIWSECKSFEHDDIKAVIWISVIINIVRNFIALDPFKNMNNNNKNSENDNEDKMLIKCTLV